MDIVNLLVKKWKVNIREDEGKMRFQLMLVEHKTNLAGVSLEKP